MKLNGREVEIVEFGGIIMQDWPDFSDAYISEARFADTGEELSESDLAQIEDISAEQMNELVHEDLASR